MGWDHKKTIDQRQSDRISKWWSIDYTWIGLAHRSWIGWLISPDGQLYRARYIDSSKVNEFYLRQATLQDYWRRGPGSGRENDSRSDSEIDKDMLDSGELVDIGNCTWHICHQPAFSKAGEPLAKSLWNDADWQFVDQLIANRLVKAEPTDTEKTGAPTYEECRAILSGVMIGSIPNAGGNLNINCNFAYFLRPVEFKDTTFESKLALSSCSFLGGVTFERSIFAHGIDADSIICLGRLSLISSTINMGANFNESAFSDYVMITNSSIESYSSSSAIYSGYFLTKESTFLNIAILDKCNFIVNVDFASVNFSGGFLFDESIFDARFRISGNCLEKVSFREARFNGKASIGFYLVGSQYGAFRAFSGVIFADVPDFSDSRHIPIFAFDGCIFERGIVWPEPRGNLSTEERDAELDFKKFILGSVLNATEDELANRIEYNSSGSHQRQTEENKNLVLRALEGGYATLKAAMSKSQDDARELRFHRFQLNVRSHRTDISMVEKFLSHIYAVSSNYGIDPLRPIIWLAIFAFVFALLYSAIDASLAGYIFDARDRTVWPRFMAVAVEISLTRMFPLSLVFGRDILAAANVWEGALEIAQANVSALLLFLFGLAVKRKFQVK